MLLLENPPDVRYMPNFVSPGVGLLVLQGTNICMSNPIVTRAISGAVATDHDLFHRALAEAAQEYRLRREGT